MLDGWIKVHRSLLNHTTFTNPKLLKVWVWCLLKARHKSGYAYIGRQKIFIKEGQFIFGRLRAAEKLNMPPSTVWDYMKILGSDRSIDISSNSRFSIITIINWHFYQLGSTGVSTTNEKQMDTNKNVKNDNNIYINNQHKQQSRDRKSQYQRKYEFDPYVGNKSSGPTEEEGRTIVPQLKEEYQEKLAKYMKEQGIRNEDYIDWTKKPTETDYINERLREIRKKINNTKVEAI